MNPLHLSTPECWNLIQEYRKTWTLETNKEPQPKDPFFRSTGSYLIRSITKTAIRQRLLSVLESAIFRTPLQKKSRRFEVPPFNGFRRYFDKTTKKSFPKIVLWDS